MISTVWGRSAWYALWTLGGVAGTLSYVVVLHRRGVDVRRLLGAVVGVTLAAIVGAKLEWLLENGVPLDMLLRAPGFRFPGALIAMIVVFPLLLSLLRLPVRVSLDAIAPGIALAIAIGRIGCFLQGCCFGYPTTAPWGIRFPPGSPAFESHRLMGLLPPDAAASLPVHPLELYFALDALAIFLFLRWLALRARYAGEVALVFLVLRCWSKTLLEHLRGREFASAPNRAGEVELWIALAATLALATIAVVRHRRATATARVGKIAVAGSG